MEHSANSKQAKMRDRQLSSSRNAQKIIFADDDYRFGRENRILLVFLPPLSSSPWDSLNFPSFSRKPTEAITNGLSKNPTTQHKSNALHCRRPTKYTHFLRSHICKAQPLDAFINKPFWRSLCLICSEPIRQCFTFDPNQTNGDDRKFGLSICLFYGKPSLWSLSRISNDYIGRDDSVTFWIWSLSKSIFDATKRKDLNRLETI